MSKKKVLITGAAGRIGVVLREGLQERYDLRVMYNRTVLEQQADEEIIIGDITDLDVVEKAVDGCDAVIHMAGNPNVGASFADCHHQNSLGTYCVYEACVRRNVPRVVFASTNHVTGEYEKEGIYTTPEMPVRPDSFYGASKAHGEALGRYYADNHGLAVICLRIGSFQPVESVTGRKGDRILSTWLSHRDTVQLCWRSIEAEDVKFGIYYGISGNKRAYWDLSNAIDEIGYAPEDNAEEYA